MANNIDPISMTMGWLVGRRIAGQRGKKQKEPIAYLYNGVRLPKLPEWDKEKYPYAAIECYETASGFYYRLTVVSKDAIYKTGNDSIILSGTEGRYWAIRDDDYGPENDFAIDGGDFTSWGDSKTLSEDTAYIYYGTHVWSEARPLWTNFDFKYDGKVYISASEPIPVYE